MGNNYIDDLIQAVRRVVTPNVALLKDVLVIGGMPEKTQNLQYLSYNRNTAISRGRSCEFSAVAVINNRRIEKWQLTGYSEKLSRWVFSNRWTRNPLDLFLHKLRCDQSIMELMAEAPSRYTLLGILTTADLRCIELNTPPEQYISPVVAVPGVDADGIKSIEAFEASNQIKKLGLIGINFYRKTGKLMAL